MSVHEEIYHGVDMRVDIAILFKRFHVVGGGA